MERFVIIKNIRDYPCYANVNARLLYLHLACLVDFTTYTTARSLRQLSYDLGMGLEAVRHAMRQLERDGLIATHVATHTATQRATQRTTQRTTHITLLKINENGAPHGAPHNTPHNTPYNTPCNTPRHTQELNIIKTEEKALTHEGARECAEDLVKVLEDALAMDHAAAAAMVDAFCKRMEVKKKAWPSHADMRAHVIAWAEKRLPIRKSATPGCRKSDHEARMEEYRRAMEDAAAMDDARREAEEVAKLRRWLADAERRGDISQAGQLRRAIWELTKKDEKNSSK